MYTSPKSWSRWRRRWGHIGHSYADGNVRGNGYTYTDRYANTDGNGHAHCNTGTPHSNAYAHCNTGTYGHSDRRVRM